jgi:hypothetical protein
VISQRLWRSILDQRKQALLRRMAVKQVGFQWDEDGGLAPPVEVTLEAKTIETVTALMVRLLLAVVLAADEVEEVADER